MERAKKDNRYIPEEERAPQYTNGTKITQSREGSGKTVKLATEALLEAVSNCLSLALGNIPALFLQALQDKAHSMTMEFGWGKEKETDTQAIAEYEATSGVFVWMKMTKTLDKKEKFAPFVKTSKYVFEMTLELYRVTGVNDLAKFELKKMANQEAQGLLEELKARKEANLPALFG
jgi:hypothetical protein